MGGEAAVEVTLLSDRGVRHLMRLSLDEDLRWAFKVVPIHSGAYRSIPSKV